MGTGTPSSAPSFLALVRVMRRIWKGSNMASTLSPTFMITAMTAMVPPLGFHFGPAMVVMIKAKQLA